MNNSSSTTAARGVAVVAPPTRVSRTVPWLPTTPTQPGARWSVLNRSWIKSGPTTTAPGASRPRSTARGPAEASRTPVSANVSGSSASGRVEAMTRAETTSTARSAGT